MTGYLKVFLYLSAGEIFVRLSGFPMPGPMVGLALMLLDFGVNRKADPEVGQIFDGVSKHLAILFVPAGAGVIAHGGILSSGLFVITIAIVAGTLVTMLVTALCFRWLLGVERGADRECTTSDVNMQEVRS
jgi:holin-like protein